MSMRPFSTDELQRMRDHAKSTMLDMCTLYHRGEGAVDPYNNPRPDWSAGASMPTPCGLRLAASRELLEATQLPVYDGELRLPHGTPVDTVDRVHVTHRQGVQLAAPLRFEVIGPPMQGLTAIVLKLKTIIMEVP